MRLLLLLLLCSLVGPLVRAAGLGAISAEGALGVSLSVPFTTRARTDVIYFEQRLLATNRIWIGGKPWQPGARCLTPVQAAQCKMALRRAIYDEVGVKVASSWDARPPAMDDSRIYWLSRLYRQVSARGRPELTEALANQLLRQPTLEHVVEVLDEADRVRDPAPDDPASSLHVWADRIDEYRAVELRVYCDPTGGVSRCLLSPYLIKNPPLTAAEVEEVRGRGTFAHAEEVFGPDSNYVALARNHGGAALWATTVDGAPVEITAVVDRDGRLARLLVSPASPTQ